MHGTHHHRQRHAELAREAGIEEIALVENGEILEVSPDSLEVAGRVDTGRVYIEMMTPLGDEVMNERRAMGAGGVVTIVVELEGGVLQGAPSGNHAGGRQHGGCLGTCAQSLEPRTWEAQGVGALPNQRAPSGCRRSGSRVPLPDVHKKASLDRTAVIDEAP